MEGSTKCRFGEVRNAVFERITGFQAGKSSTTKILFRTFIYEEIVFSETELSSAVVSRCIVEIFAIVEIFLARDLITARTLAGLFFIPSTLETSRFIIDST